MTIKPNQTVTIKDRYGKLHTYRVHKVIGNVVYVYGWQQSVHISKVIKVS